MAAIGSSVRAEWAGADAVRRRVYQARRLGLFSTDRDAACTCAAARRFDAVRGRTPPRTLRPNPILPSLETLVWHPVRRLSPYCPRRKRVETGQQERLVAVESEVSVG